MQRDISKIILTIALIVAIVFVVNSLYKEKTSIVIKASESQEDVKLCSYIDGTYEVTINDDVIYKGSAGDKIWQEFEKISSIERQQFLGGFLTGCKSFGGTVAKKILFPLTLVDIAYRNIDERPHIAIDNYLTKCSEQNSNFKYDPGFWGGGFGLILNIQDDILFGGTDPPSQDLIEEFLKKLVHYCPNLYLELRGRTPQTYSYESADDFTANRFFDDVSEIYGKKLSIPTIDSVKRVILKDSLEKDLLEGTGYNTMKEYRRALVYGFTDSKGKTCSKCTNLAYDRLGKYFERLDQTENNLRNNSPLKYKKLMEETGFTREELLNEINVYQGKKR